MDIGPLTPRNQMRSVAAENRPAHREYSLFLFPLFGHVKKSCKETEFSRKNSVSLSCFSFHTPYFSDEGTVFRK